jgi:dTDP-4-amino-4,6-dideoxygalactose transaminase
MIPFSPLRIDKKIVDEVVDTLYSGWITTGPKTKKFEQKLTEYGGHLKTLCVSSASAGLELMLRWFGVTKGDEVIVPAYTYSATANVVEHCGAKVVFVDSECDFNISVKSIEEAITPLTKVIIPVDIAGFPCHYDEINDLVRRNDIQKLFRPSGQEQEQLNRILVLSDAAHSIGAQYKGKRSGNLTDLTVYSFHAVKNLTTAEGGAVCLNLTAPFDNNRVYELLNIKSLHGQTKNALEKMQIGSWSYDILEPGYKYNMTDIQASIGLVELDRYDNDMLVKRKHIFDSYTRELIKFSWAQVPEYQNDQKISSYHANLLQIKGIDETRRNLIIKLIYEKGVSVNVHFIPLPMMIYYKKSGYRIEDYPASYDNYSREISLPVFYDLTDEQIRAVVKAVVDSVKSTI